MVKRIKSLPGAPLTLELPGEHPREGPDPSRRGRASRWRALGEGWPGDPVLAWGRKDGARDTLVEQVLPTCWALGRETFALVT